MSESMREQIVYFENNGFVVLFTGESVDGDEYIVAENGGLAFTVRNQGEHSRKFFIVKLCEPSKAISIAKRHCAQQQNYCSIKKKG